MRYLHDLVVGNFGVPAPEAVTVEMANALVDPVLGGFLDDHEQSLRQAIRRAQELGAKLAAGSA